MMEKTSICPGDSQPEKRSSIVERWPIEHEDRTRLDTFSFRPPAVQDSVVVSLPVPLMTTTTGSSPWNYCLCEDIEESTDLDAYLAGSGKAVSTQ